jgi:Uma2 family endonuclease
MRPPSLAVVQYAQEKVDTMTQTGLQQTWTEDALMALPDVGHKCELLSGRLSMTPCGSEHGGISSLIGAKLTLHVLEKRLGRVFDSSTGFWMRSGNLRSPDVSFIAGARLKGLRRLPAGFFRGSPDLAVEILSPSDTFERVHERIVEYFENDTRLVWIVHPSERTVSVCHQPGPDSILRVGQVLGGESVVPGFALPVGEIFAELDFE